VKFEKVVVMTAWKRPEYLARVLESLRRSVGIEEYTVAKYGTMLREGRALWFPDCVLRTEDYK